MEVYQRLARHLESLVMGYPYSEALIDLLKAMFTPAEAEAVLAIPNDLAPLEAAGLDRAAKRTSLPYNELETALESAADKNMIYSTRLPSGEKGYALHQVGYGMPQAFFWHGRTDETAAKMARLVLKYFTVPVTREVYGGSPTKTFKYSPVGAKIEVPKQGVLPHEEILAIVNRAEKIALAHCPCRMSARILGRTDCTHSLEVCFKYDEMAEFVISRGLAREVSRDETAHIMGECEREGLVHMVDNTRGETKHTCNCCGHYCWNVGIIKRRKIPRDVLMAVYFIRETDFEACLACGACAEICPVEAVRLSGGEIEVDKDWCIGCGVCAGVCPTNAISIVRRFEDTGPADHPELVNRIRIERGLI